MNFEKEKNIIPFSCFSSHPIKKKKQKKLLPQIYNLKRKKISLVFFYVCWDVTTKENMFFHLQFLVMRVFFPLFFT